MVAFVSRFVYPLPVRKPLNLEIVIRNRSPRLGVQGIHIMQEYDLNPEELTKGKEAVVGLT